MVEIRRVLPHGYVLKPSGEVALGFGAGVRQVVALVQPSSSGGARWAA